MAETETLSPTVRDKGEINLSWLLTLRWGAILGQVSLIVGSQVVLPVELPLAPLLTIILVTVVTNLAATSASRLSRRAQDITIILMVLDVLLLTALLYFSGGPANPFSSLYLVNIALAAIVLPPRWTWILVVLSIGAFGGLFFTHHEVTLTVPIETHIHMPLHTEGMWASFSIAAVFIVYFATRLTSALEERERELAAARDLANRTEKLASLATLSAGAAHELSTPLSTIAVVAKELERHLEKRSGDETAIEDARLIREQVHRCRRILDQMANDAGASAGEGLVRISVQDLVDEAVEALATPEQIRVDAPAQTLETDLYVPTHALAQALRSVVKNAQDASPPNSLVNLGIQSDGDSIVFEVRDRGAGMPREIAARAGEPFFTTKDAGRGMGLGLFLTRTVLEGLGGDLQIESYEGRGTTARLRVPLSSVQPRAGSV